MPMSGCITTGRRAGFCRSTGMEGDFEGAQRLLDEFLFFAVGVDGVVVVPDRANDPAIACHCVDIQKTDGTTKPICFKPGVVGTLSQDQVRDLCRAREPLRHPEGIQRRVATFERAAAECAGTHLDNRLDCMSWALKRDGIDWGLGGR